MLSSVQPVRRTIVSTSFVARSHSIVVRRRDQHLDRAPLLVAAISGDRQTVNRTQHVDRLPFGRVVDHAP